MLARFLDRLWVIGAFDDFGPPGNVSVLFDGINSICWHRRAPRRNYIWPHAHVGPGLLVGNIGRAQNENRLPLMLTLVRALCVTARTRQIFEPRPVRIEDGESRFPL
jgi:hypothetical protein